MDNRPIGVFDSGIGGLTVLRDLIESFPAQDFIYLGDTKNCPYGLKTTDELKRIVEKNIRYLESKQVKAIVIACNTATVNSYDIQSSIPIIRIIEPTVTRVKEVGGRIGILATNYTVQSKIYQKLIGSNAIGIPCSPFVDVVEQGLSGTPEAFRVVESILAPYVGLLDTVVLGCTHFGLLEHEIRQVLGSIQVVDSSKSIAPILKNQFTWPKSTQKSGFIHILVTGDIKTFNIKWFDKPIHQLEHISF